MEWDAVVSKVKCCLLIVPCHRTQLRQNKCSAYPSDQLAEAVEAEVLPYMACAPGAVAAAKKLTRDLGPRLDESTIDHTIKALVDRWEGAEAPEGIAAFFEKRKPSWQR